MSTRPNRAVEIARQFERSEGQHISLRILSARLNDAFPGGEGLADRLGFPSLTSFLNTTGFFKTTGEFPRIHVVVTEERAPGRLPVTQQPIKKAAPSGLGDVTFLKQPVKRKNVPPVPKIAPNPVQSDGGKASKVNSERLDQPNIDKATIFSTISQCVLDFVKSGISGNKTVFQTDIGTMLTNKYGSRPTIYKQCGYNTLSGMLKSISGLAFSPYKNNAIVTIENVAGRQAESVSSFLRPADYQVHTQASKSRAVTAQEAATPSLEDVEAFVLSEIDKQKARSIPLVFLGEALLKQFPGPQSVHKRFNCRTLGNLLRRCKSLVVVGENDSSSVMRASTVVGEPQSTSDSLTFVNIALANEFEGFVLGAIDDSAIDKGVSLATLGFKIRRRFPGSQPIVERLGASTLSGLLAKFPSIEVVTENSSAYVRRRGKSGSVVEPESAKFGAFDLDV